MATSQAVVPALRWPGGAGGMEAREALFMFGSAKCSPGTAPAATGPNYSTHSPPHAASLGPNEAGTGHPKPAAAPSFPTPHSGRRVWTPWTPVPAQTLAQGCSQPRCHGHPEHESRAWQMGTHSWRAPCQQHEAGGRAAPREGPTLALPGAFSSSPRQELDGPRSFLESSASFQPRGKRCCGARAKSQPRGTSRPGRGWPPGAGGRTDTRTGAVPGLAAARLGATTAARAAFSPRTPIERTPHTPI